jgi:hypothetical protein
MNYVKLLEKNSFFIDIFLQVGKSLAGLINTQKLNTPYKI